MTARSRRVDWRTNISSSLNLMRLIPAPPLNHVLRVNWWSYMTLAESGNQLASSLAALVEGPLPADNQDGIGIDQNALRDNPDLKAIVVATPASSTTTNASASGRPAIPHFTFPGGLWTVEDMWGGFITDSGVDRLSMSIGYQVLDLPASEYQWAQRNGFNAFDVGTLLQ